MRRRWCRFFAPANRLWLVGYVTMVAVVIFSPECGAQQIPPTGVRPGDRPLAIPDLERPLTAPDLAPAKPTEPQQWLSSGIEVDVNKIHIEFVGSDGKPFDWKGKDPPREFTRSKLQKAIIKNYEDRKLTTEDLVRLRNELTEFYYKRGYVNSGAVIPDQVVPNKGVMMVQIVVGELPLDQIQIRGLEDRGIGHLRDSYVKDRVAFGVKKPLNITPLQERLQLLLRDQSIKSIQGSLQPGVRPGDSRLTVKVTEQPRFNVELFSNNDRPPSVGEYQGILVGRVRNVFGLNDPLELAFSLTEGLKDGYFSYELPVASGLPLTSNDLRAFISGEITDADVVEEPFQVLDITSKTETIEFGLRYPVYRAISGLTGDRREQGDSKSSGRSLGKADIWEKEFSLEFGLARRHNETFLLGRPFSFSEGVQNGKTDVSVLRLVQSGFLRSEDQVFVARSTFSIGLDAWGATINETGPDGKFVAWLGQAQWARRIPIPISDLNSQLLVRGDLQLAADPLLAIEQFAIGGLNSVRGYRRNQLVRDSGWSASVEYRVPVFQIPVPRLSRTPEDGWFWFAPFVDGGGGWNQDRATLSPRNIYSVGAGIIWGPSRLVRAELYYGHRLTDVPDPEDKGLQDYGICFNVRVGFDFDM